MKVFIDYIFIAFLLSSFFFNIGDGQDVKKHLVTIDHPAFEEGQSNEFYLWEIRGKNDEIDGYYLDVESVIYVDHRCKIVPIRMHWDAFGTYRKYELTHGRILEKKEGKPFLPEDYEQLHRILKDKSSPYADLSYYEITHKKVHGESQVDAVTGETSIVFDEEKTVLGGAWTCYTLWHWANGEAVSEIQRITGKLSDKEELLTYLKAPDRITQEFALQEFTKRKHYADAVLKAITEQASKSEIGQHFFKEALNYLEEAPTALYFEAVKNLLETESKKRRTMLWNSMLGYGISPPPAYLNGFLAKLTASRNYQEIDLFLTILEKKNVASDEAIKKMIPLLEEDYSILNRRIYWFLNKQKLSEDQKQLLQSYFNKYSDYLQ
ncbi:hypothetical protein [Flagellimonas algicola]|uniref:Uncharacterized protein n=1 Tax=Flagellimonas algicola TaxID=2583815 RepID=A0ABY2WS45_9FLAO|nr:hypothetical protein [Allomuricauda algicola]TMU57339.1 hypothetical protein FGG15_07285 [Allomuricauda algicola]